MNGIQIQTHAIGDLANKITLDWYEEAFNKVSPENRIIENPRWRVEHAQNIKPEDQQRYSDLEVVAQCNLLMRLAIYISLTKDWERKIKRCVYLEKLIELGVVVVGGSDAPVEIGDPRIEFKAAVSRKDLDGFMEDWWNIEEVVSREKLCICLQNGRPIPFLKRI